MIIMLSFPQLPIKPTSPSKPAPEIVKISKTQKKPPQHEIGSSVSLQYLTCFEIIKSKFLTKPFKAFNALILQ